MSRFADVALMTLAALDEARIDGSVRIDRPLLTDEVRLHVRDLRTAARTPQRAEVLRFLQSLTVAWCLDSRDVESYVGIVMPILRKAAPGRRCELLDDLMDSESFRRWLELEGGYERAAETPIENHHIFGGKRRQDLGSNLLRLCLTVHFWCHNVAPVEGRLACVWRRSQLPGFEWRELDECAGFRVLGWVESHEVQAEPFRGMRRDLLTI